MLAEAAEAWPPPSQFLLYKILPSTSHLASSDGQHLGHIAARESGKCSFGLPVSAVWEVDGKKSWAQLLNCWATPSRAFFWDSGPPATLPQIQKTGREISPSTSIFCLSLHVCLYIQQRLAHFDELSLLVFISYLR